MLAAARCSESAAVSFLVHFLFSYNQAREKVRSLSAGEQSRSQMARLRLSGANCLMADGATNNLHILSAEVLENALPELEGSVLVISPDRHFLERTADRVTEREDDVLTSYLGGFSDYQPARAAKGASRKLTALLRRLHLSPHPAMLQVTAPGIRSGLLVFSNQLKGESAPWNNCCGLLMT